LVPKSSRSDREPLLRGTLTERETLIYSEKAQGPLPQQTPSRPSARENLHPTVKPLELMRHLVRLVTPPGGVVLDCFLPLGLAL
jgi:site-specific DNA-methyltransferase (adenine-specific)